MISIASKEWLRQLILVSTTNHESAPRGKKTKELIGSRVMVAMDYPVVYHPLRGLDYRFMAAESAWIISGSNSLDFQHQIREKLEPYSDDHERMSGAYGPPFIDQLPYVVDVLKKDPDSRQAVITVWRPRPYPSKDIPCTVALQFLLRQEHIHTNVFMRSSDVWLGLPYDIFSFTIMSMVIALRLGVKNLGVLRILLGSSHLYEENFERAESLINSDNHILFQRKWEPGGCIIPNIQSLTKLLLLAANGGTNKEALTLLSATPEEI